MKYITNNDLLPLLFDMKKNVSFWDSRQNKIAESITHDEKWNYHINESGQSRYGLFALSNILIAKNSFQLSTELYDEKIIKFILYVNNHISYYSKSDLTYGGLTSLILAVKSYELNDIDIKEVERIFDETLDSVLKGCDNQDSLILIAGKYLNDISPDLNRLKKLKSLTDRYLKSMNVTGYFETGDIRAIYHQRNMYILWGLIHASYFYAERTEEIKNSVIKCLNWVWYNNRDKFDDAFHWHPAFYWTKNKYKIKVPVINIKSSRYLFECHQTFFANAVNFYQLRFNSYEFAKRKERAIEWIFGKNRIKKDLTEINGRMLPIRIMDLSGNIFINGQKFKGSYEVGSYILALVAENYFRTYK